MTEDQSTELEKFQKYFKEDHLIVHNLSKILFLILLVFGFYIHIHGGIRPGGGFQSGIIFCIAIISHDLLMYQNHYKDLFIEKIKVQYFIFSGLILFGVILLSSCLNLKNYAFYNIKNIKLFNSLNVFFFEIAISLIVFSSFIIIFKNMFQLLKKVDIFK